MPSCASCPRTAHPAAHVASHPIQSLTGVLLEMVCAQYMIHLQCAHRTTFIKIINTFIKHERVKKSGVAVTSRV